MTTARIDYPGYQATRSQQLMFTQLLQKVPGEVVIIHHVSEDSPTRLQLEVERRTPYEFGWKISFERVVL